MAEQPFVSYVELILDKLAREPERPVVVAADGGRVSAAEFTDDVHGLAAEMAERGIGRGSTVALLIGNRPEALSARYAANLLGARVVFLYEGMAPEIQARIVDSVETALLVVDPDLEEPARALTAVLPRPPAELTLHADHADHATRRPRRAGLRVPAAARPEDDWCIRHTGGTTGIPKGVPMTHGPYERALRSIAVGSGGGAGAAGGAAERTERAAAVEPRFLACTTLAHLAGLVADGTLLAGGRVVLRPGFDPGDVLAAVERERLTDLWLLPPLLYRLLDHPDIATTDLSSLRRISYGGCPASAARLRQAAEVFGPVLYGWYGQAEAGLITEVGPAEHAVTGGAGQITVGRATPGVEIAVRDETGAAVEPGTVGEIFVHTPQTMTGYWKQPELTAEVLGPDGWVRTGDAGYLDEDGYLFLVDRVKDLIIVVGGHVYPAELEELLLTHPAVAHCAVFGVRREDESEEVRAAIVPVPGGLVDSASVREFVTARKGAMYAPSRVHTVDRIPLTAAGKPDKKLLRARFGG
ncbi:AMP-binding protein [Streptomyces sp. SAJ15]|uniref:AMP-binding protein n=1 Tax=Streptomyces sp. SAJ15 TaxID=2011095 RepID=UPI0011862057|nr:AMP-binding protein [Streptomyces sp. SAJ15]TVL91959.1 fatty acid--CoA ligase [Streptomyces sp. SAJ15]